MFYQPNEPADFDEFTDSIYDRSILSGMDDREATTRAAQDISFAMGRSAQLLRWTSSDILHTTVFDPSEVVNTLMSQANLQMVWRVLSAWGQMASIIMGLVLLWACLKCVLPRRFSRLLSNDNPLPRRSNSPPVLGHVLSHLLLYGHVNDGLSVGG